MGNARNLQECREERFDRIVEILGIEVLQPVEQQGIIVREKTRIL